MQIEISIGKVGMQPPKNKLIKKGTDIKHFMALQMQKYLTHGAYKLQKYTYEFRLKRV